MLAITPKQAAEELQVSLATVYRWMKNGRLKTLPGRGEARILLSQFAENREKEERLQRIWGK